MSDVNAAAEIADHVLSRVTKTGACYGCVYPHGHPPPGIKEAYELASWFRKEHPADDGEAIRTMEMKPTERGFAAIYCENYPKYEQARLVQESSAIREYDDAMEKPGSSCLWIGDDFHLNREQVRELVGVLQHWLRNKTLRNY